MTSTQIVDRVMDPHVTNLGSLGVALVSAAKKAAARPRPALRDGHEIGHDYPADDFVLRDGKWHPADD